MAPRKSWRLGWQSQNLARFILYKFSFLAEPVQVADDIGIDYFCTLFETKRRSRNADLIPRSSFAIQIKSQSRWNKVDLTGYVPYLAQLELPFLLGIVDRSKLNLTIFSGEFLTPFFAYKGQSGRLVAELCERSAITKQFDWVTAHPTGGHKLKFPKIAEIAADISDADLEAKVIEIRRLCSLMLDNLAASINKQFILKATAPYQYLLFAGPESLQLFEVNFFKRLSEAFFNLNWIYSIAQNKPDIEERFRLYERIYLQLVSYYGEQSLPDLLRQTYKDTKKVIDNS